MFVPEGVRESYCEGVLSIVVLSARGSENRHYTSILECCGSSYGKWHMSGLGRKSYADTGGGSTMGISEIYDSGGVDFL